MKEVFKIETWTLDQLKVTKPLPETSSFVGGFYVGLFVLIKLESLIQISKSIHHKSILFELYHQFSISSLSRFQVLIRIMFF